MTMQALCGELPATDSIAVREWTWLSMPCRPELTDGTLTIHQRRNLNGKRCQTDRYAIQEQDLGDTTDRRAFLVENISNPIPTTLAAHVQPDDSQDQPYLVTITANPDHDSCTCKAASTGKRCKHREALRAVIEAGGLEPATSEAIHAEHEQALAEAPEQPRQVVTIMVYADLGESAEAIATDLLPLGVVIDQADGINDGFGSTAWVDCLDWGTAARVRQALEEDRRVKCYELKQPVKAPEKHEPDLCFVCGEEMPAGGHDHNQCAKSPVKKPAYRTAELEGGF